MLTYNNIVSVFRRFVAGHDQLRRFTHGNFAVADLEKDGEYPALHLAPDGFGLDVSDSFRLDIYIYDKPRDKDEASKSDYQAEVLSDAHLIMKDIVADIINGGNIFGFDQLYGIEIPASGDFFIEFDKNVLSGVRVSLVITSPWGIDACELPLTAVEPPTPSACLPVTVENSNQSFQVNIQSGDVEVLEDYEFEFQDENQVVTATEIRPAMIGETFIIESYCPTQFSYNLNINGVFSQVVTVDISDDINININ